MKRTISIFIFMLLFMNASAMGYEGIKQTNTASAQLIVVGMEENDNNNTEEVVLMMDEQSSLSLQDQYLDQRRQQTNQLTGFAVSTETQNIEKGLLNILIILSITLIGLLGYLYKQRKKS